VYPLMIGASYSSAANVSAFGAFGLSSLKRRSWRLGPGQPSATLPLTRPLPSYLLPSLSSTFITKESDMGNCGGKLDCVGRDSIEGNADIVGNGVCHLTIHRVAQGYRSGLLVSIKGLC
jgi:hypothetical protein